ncbi:hypothetical protein ABC337_08150 [Arthrobacter sp. 1P04PC]|uniref:hypothetical protein n=1 Tax=unclassified Arthrobacter TaxID=235627 RepID=UPI0039A2A31D
MEALLIPLAILVLAAVVVMLVARTLGRRRNAGAESGPTGAPPSPEAARAAAQGLDQDQHRRVYAFIARGQAVAAIQAYREATGTGLRAARDAVAALAAHPQPFREAAPADAPAEDAGAPQHFPYRYRAIASRGEVTREVSSTKLNDEIYGRIRRQAADGDVEGAAAALCRHSDITLDDAREFIALLED